MHIPNLILMDFQMVALSVAKNRDFVWKMVCIEWARALSGEYG